MTELLSTEDAARIVGLTPLTIRRAIHEGELPASKLRGQWRIEADDLAAWIAAGRRQQARTLERGARGVTPRTPKPKPAAAAVPAGSFLDAVRARRNAA